MSGGVAPAPLGRILRAEEVGLYRDAAGALAQAAAEAERMRAEAGREIAAERLRVLKDAEREARAASVRILAEATEAATRAVAALPREIAEAIAEGVAKVIGGVDLAEAVARAAERAVAELAERQSVVVRVNPLALGRARARLARAADFVRVAGDTALAADECTIETKSGFVRAGLGEQIAALRQALADAVAPAEEAAREDA